MVVKKSPPNTALLNVTLISPLLCFKWIPVDYFKRTFLPNHCAVGMDLLFIVKAQEVCSNFCVDIQLSCLSCTPAPGRTEGDGFSSQCLCIRMVLWLFGLHSVCLGTYWGVRRGSSPFTPGLSYRATRKPLGKRQASRIAPFSLPRCLQGAGIGSGLTCLGKKEKSRICLFSVFSNAAVLSPLTCPWWGSPLEISLWKSTTGYAKRTVDNWHTKAYTLATCVRKWDITGTCGTATSS